MKYQIFLYWYYTDSNSVDSNKSGESITGACLFPFKCMSMSRGGEGVRNIYYHFDNNLTLYSKIPRSIKTWSHTSLYPKNIEYCTSQSDAYRVG